MNTHTYTLVAWHVEIPATASGMAVGDRVDKFVFAAPNEEVLRDHLVEYGFVKRPNLPAVVMRQMTDEELDARMRVTGEDGSPRGPGSYDTTARDELEMMDDVGVLAAPLWWH